MSTLGGEGRLQQDGSSGSKVIRVFEGSLSVRRAPDRTLIPTTVGVSIVLLKVVEIEEENHAIEFQYEIIMKWRDNRLTYRPTPTSSSVSSS